jgi:ankyrin repeat protein
VNDFIAEQNYTMLHRIILGLSMANLEKETCPHPEDVNTADVMGRTPLAWAAFGRTIE